MKKAKVSETHHKFSTVIERDEPYQRWIWTKTRIPNQADYPYVRIASGITTTKLGARWASWRAGSEVPHRDLD